MSDVTRISMPVDGTDATNVRLERRRAISLFRLIDRSREEEKRDTSDARNPNIAARSALGDQLVRHYAQSTFDDDAGTCGNADTCTQQQLAELVLQRNYRSWWRSIKATMTSLGLCCVAGMGEMDLIRRRYLLHDGRPPAPSAISVAGSDCLPSIVTNRVLSRSIPMRVYPIAPDAKKNSDSIVPWTFQVEIPPCFDASLFVRVQLSSRSLTTL